MTLNPVRLLTIATLWFAAFALAMPVVASDFTDLVADEHVGVVNISTARHVDPETAPQSRDELLRRFFGPDQGRPDRAESSLGSGFLISADGFVLTNGHIVANADEIIVRLHDRRQYEAEVIGVDPRSDVALLKIDASGLPHVRIGDPADLQVGSWVLAIGSPFGFDHSVTAGIVSAKGRSLPDESYVPFIQTDVAINPGNSGGPLFNTDGEVVGINAQILSHTGGSMGVSFTIPIDIAMEVAAQLRTEGRVTRGWLGVVIQQVTGDLAETFGMERTRGALVTRVLADSPAERAGLRIGDVILRYEGREVTESTALPAMVGRTPVGTAARMVIVRDGERRELPVEIGRLPEREALAERVGPGGSGERGASAPGRLGLRVGPVEERVREELSLGDGGVQLVAPPREAAASADLSEGDVLVLMNSRPIAGVDDFREQVAQLDAGSKVALLVQRPGGPQFVAIEVPESGAN
ncbi:MAG: Do family serine endopeptidase [Halofilum sp. (in: g-proteobacteria)]